MIKKFLSSLRLSRHIYYTVVFSGGYLLACRELNTLLSCRYVSGFILINLLFAASLAVNNLFDTDIDRLNNKTNTFSLGLLPPAGYRAFVYLLIILTSALSFFLGAAVFVLSIIIHLTSFIYSAPPLRLKKLFPLNTFIIAAASLEAMLLGYACCPATTNILDFPTRLAAALLVCLTLAFNTKDINDYEGDRAYSINTLPVLLGQKPGKYFTAACALAGYILFPIITGAFSFTAVSAVFGIITASAIVLPRRRISESLIFSLVFLYALIYVIINPAGF